MAYVPPPAHIVQKMNGSEGWANGVWNSIISHYFPQATHCILPELRVGDQRPDLTVFTNADPPLPILVFEGKSYQGADAAWDRAISQALDYIKTISRNNALVARGSYCRFITNVGGTDCQLRPDVNDATIWKRKKQGINNDLHVVDDAAEIHDSFLLVLNGARVP